MILLLVMCVLLISSCGSNQNEPLANGIDETMNDEQQNSEGNESISVVGEEMKAAPKLSDCKFIAEGNLFSLVITTDGSLWAWGQNDDGQLGDGTRTYWDNGNEIDNGKTSPIKIMGDVVSVAAGAFHSLAIKSDGSLWAWGNNDAGQLGDGTITTFDETEYPPWNWDIIEDNSKSTPIKIMDGVVSVAAGYNHNLAIKTDGSLWAWGWIRSDRLSAGGIVYKTEPVQL